MSNELYDAIGKFDDLVSQKESQELVLMKLKCEIREQKNIVKRLKREHDREKEEEGRPRSATTTVAKHGGSHETTGMLADSLHSRVKVRRGRNERHEQESPRRRVHSINSCSRAQDTRAAHRRVHLLSRTLSHGGASSVD